MGKNRSNPSSRKQQAATGLGVLIVGALAWLFGGFTRGGSLEWIKSLLIAVGLALLIRWVLTEPFRIPSPSMEPTLHGDERMFHGDRVFVNKFVYGLRFPLNGSRIPFTTNRIHYADRRIWQRAGPKRWDMVVFNAAEENVLHTTLVKRVVGLPGERIHIANGKVYVNGTPLDLPPGMPDVHYTSSTRSIEPMVYGILTDEAHAVVPPDCYLVLGDNSDRSRDGRYFGWLPNERILGRVSCIWWPISRWRDFSGFSKTWWWRTILALLSFLVLVRLFFGRSWHLPWFNNRGQVKMDHFYINRWAFGIPIPFTRARLYKGRDPRRGELVLYRRRKAPKGEPTILLGCVAGLPGERVFLNAGKLQIDGAPLVRPESLAGREFPSGEGVGPYARSKGKEFSQVPDDHFFILTESNIPEDHFDSRTIGWIAHRDLVGSATVVWWPPTRWRRAR
jgi:signal peptidase I